MKTHIILLLILCNIALHGQNSPTTTISSDSKSGVNEYIEVIGSKDDSYIIRCKYDPGNSGLVKLNSSLEEIASFKIENTIPGLKQMVQLYGIYSVGNNIIIVQTTGNSKSKLPTLYTQILEKNDFSQVKAIGEFKVTAGLFNIHLTPDGNKLAYVEKNSSPNNYNVTLFNQDLVIAQEFAVTLPQNLYHGRAILENPNVLTQKDFSRMEMLYKALDVADKWHFDNSGNIYITGVKSEKSGKESSIKYHVVSVTGKGINIIDHPLDLPGKFITQIELQLASNGQLIATGFYSNISASEFSNGLFSFVLDPAKESIISSAFYPFESGIITEAMTVISNDKASGEPGMKGYSINKVIANNASGVTMVSEQIFGRDFSITRNQNVALYNHNSILVSEFDSSGKLKWNTVIPKNQISRNEYVQYASFEMKHEKETMYFIFNDHVKNAAVLKGEVSKLDIKSKDNVIAVVTLDNNGIASKKTLQEKLVIKPKMQLLNNLITPCELDEKEHLVLVKI